MIKAGCRQTTVNFVYCLWQLVQVCPDVMRFVKSRAPLIEFLGLGKDVDTMRGSCPADGVLTVLKVEHGIK